MNKKKEAEDMRYIYIIMFDSDKEHTWKALTSYVGWRLEVLIKTDKIGIIENVVDF